MIVIKVSGKREAHPAIALRFHDSERSSFGDAKVGAADGDLGGEELAPQMLASRGGERSRFVG